ncbi:MAG: hypothetical protein M4D80_24785 [Myxococcota bacterium]|nr:hypothetical protein [Deltaproteobacteria bacterium]MDQ3338396.1 hypothetical protein [Myxococcota bacterium]
MWKLVCIAILSCNSPAPASPPSYEQVRENLEARRVKLARDLETQPARAIAAARVTLIEALRDELLPAWNGTAWAMNGTSQKPNDGAIACGYFVSTTLLHAGFRVERARLGQQASTFITRSLVTSEPIWQTSDQPIDAFVDRVRKSGDGIYLVGLDSHVGFIIVDGKHTWFHHSGPGEEGVRREPARTASFLSPSRYRQVAKLFDDALVEKWLRGDAIATVLPRR